MDRRGFFLTLLTTPLLAPILLRAQSSSNTLELFHIGNKPDKYIPLLLEHVQELGSGKGQSYSLLNSHPQRKELERTFSRAGWSSIQDPHLADWVLNFHVLHHKALPSFTLVRNGRIWDIRTQKLHSLWKEMNSLHQPSALLTTAAFKYRSAKKASGKHAAVYIDGEKTDRITLSDDLSRIYRTRKGNVNVRAKEGRIWVSGSSCKNKVCCCTAPIFQTGERIICAPNHFLLEIEGTPFLDTVIG
jgi:hypothetical protein